MSQFWSQLVHQLTPYVPGEQPKVPDLVKLNLKETVTYMPLRVGFTTSGTPSNINVGRTIATSEGRLIDSKGRLLAHGTETCLIFAAR